MLNSTTYEGPKERWGNVFHGERQRHPLLRRYMAAGLSFHATFTVLFYFEGYIFLDFIARLAPRNTRRRGDLLKFYTVPYLRARLCKMETARRIFLIDGWGGVTIFFLIVWRGLLFSFNRANIFLDILFG